MSPEAVTLDGGGPERHPAEFRRTVAGVDITLTDGLAVDCRPPSGEAG